MPPEPAAADRTAAIESTAGAEVDAGRVAERVLRVRAFRASSWHPLPGNLHDRLGLSCIAHDRHRANHRTFACSTPMPVPAGFDHTRAGSSHDA